LCGFACFRAALRADCARGACAIGVGSMDDQAAGARAPVPPLPSASEDSRCAASLESPRSRPLESLRLQTPRQTILPYDSASEVRVHVYHCDQYTGFLNNVLLKKQEIGIYHVGVEVYGQEWSFQYYEDTWNDSSVSGVMRCRPKSMTEYEHQETISLGCTPLGEDEVDTIVWQLHSDWPACSYHLTRHNCITFADTLVTKLQAPQFFPAWLKGIVDASNSRENVDAIVDYSWSWMKWWMIRKHQREEEQAQNGDSSGGHSLWTLLLHPSAACGGSSLCPGGKRADVDEIPAAPLPHDLHDHVVPPLPPAIMASGSSAKELQPKCIHASMAPASPPQAKDSRQLLTADAGKGFGRMVLEETLSGRLEERPVIE